MCDHMHSIGLWCLGRISCNQGARGVTNPCYLFRPVVLGQVLRSSRVLKGVATAPPKTPKVVSGAKGEADCE
jgi:hypothetical protein